MMKLLVVDFSAITFSSFAIMLLNFIYWCKLDGAKYPA